jgi:ribonuclease R
LFVKLDDTGADGFIPARTIGTEYFRYQEDRHALIGNISGETYRLGDPVSVKLVEAAPVAGALRFELSEGRYDVGTGAAPPKGTSAAGSAAARKGTDDATDGSSSIPRYLVGHVARLARTLSELR